MQFVVNIISLPILLCVLASTIRITFHIDIDKSKYPFIHTLTKPVWCVALIIFMPWAIAGFAKNQISYFPWEALTDYLDHGFIEALDFFLCVLVVDLWMFVTAGQLAIKFTENNENLTEKEKFSNYILYIVVNLLSGYFIVMQASNFYDIFQHINLTTAYFIIGITLLAIFFHARFTPSMAAKAPAILTTCGILGTFIGVAIGLMDFDPSSVQRSVPALIEGIKTAFWASAFGVFFALTVKLREVFFGVRIPDSFKTRVTAEDVASLISSMHESLVSKNEASLYTLLTLAREENNARLEELTQLIRNSMNQKQLSEKPNSK